MQDGISVTRAWYRCESCENCPQGERCCRKQDINAPKEVIWKKTFWEKREVSLQNITSDRGDYAENEPFYPGRRGIRAAKERF